MNSWHVRARLGPSGQSDELVRLSVDSIMITGTNSGRGGELGRSSEQLLSLNADGSLKPHEGAFAQAQWPRERAAMAARMSRCRDACAIGSLKIGCKLRNVPTCLIGLAYDGVLLSVIRGRGDQDCRREQRLEDVLPRQRVHR
jgi:hypothetical protein